MTPAEAAAFIRARLPITPLPDVPGIRLHRAGPASGLGQVASGSSPYWAYAWAGGLALARFLLDRPETVAGRRVVDVGAGSGLVGIAAAKAGAAAVVAIDRDPLAIVAIGLNAAANGVTLTAIHADPADAPVPDADIVLAGDVFYDAGLAAKMTELLARCAEKGMEVLGGDPWRAPLPLRHLRELARYEVAETGAATRPSGVFAFRRTMG